MSECNYIVVHCSDSPNSLNDDRLDKAADIHRWHIERGFEGIGYHYVIDENGFIDYGRPVFLDEQTFYKGAHVRGYNHESIGICLIGGKIFHEQQLENLARMLAYLHEAFPDAEIVGHCDLDKRKTCPNFNVKKFCIDRGVIK